LVFGEVVFLTKGILLFGRKAEEVCFPSRAEIDVPTPELAEQ